MRKGIFFFLLFIGPFFTGSAQSLGDTVYSDTCLFYTPCDLVRYDTAGVWERGRSDKPYFGYWGQPVQGLVTDTVASYDTLVDSYFELRIPLEYPYLESGNIILSFRHKYRTDSLIDGGYIEVSHDSGQTWKNLIHDDSALAFYTKNLYSDQDSLMGGHSGFSGSSDGWVHSQVHWTWAYPLKRNGANIPDTSYLRFHFISDSNQTNKEGWMIERFEFSSIYMTSVEEHEAEELLHGVRPNPMRSSTRIGFDEEELKGARFRLMDPQGRIVREIEAVRDSPLQLERNGLGSGVYYFRFFSGRKTASGKLIVR